MSDVRPFRRIDEKHLKLQPGDPSPLPGHDGHRVASTSFNGDATEWWLRIKCSCGEVLSGAASR